MSKGMSGSGEKEKGEFWRRERANVAVKRERKRERTIERTLVLDHVSQLSSHGESEEAVERNRTRERGGKGRRCELDETRPGERETRTRQDEEDRRKGWR